MTLHCGDTDETSIGIDGHSTLVVWTIAADEAELTLDDWQGSLGEPREAMAINAKRSACCFQRRVRFRACW